MVQPGAVMRNAMANMRASQSLWNASSGSSASTLPKPWRPPRSCVPSIALASERLEVAFPKVDHHLILAVRRLGPELGRGEGHGVERLRVLLSARARVRQDVMAAQVRDPSGAPARIARQAR